MSFIEVNAERENTCCVIMDKTPTHALFYSTLY